MTWTARGFCLAALLALTVPAVAGAETPVDQPLGWYDGGADAPGTVEFRSVAALHTASAGDVVVAVGRDTLSKRAVIYRLAGGAWHQDAIAAAGANSCLDSVSVTDTAAWAVGSQGGGCGLGDQPGRALILRFPVESGPIAAAPPADDDSTTTTSSSTTSTTSTTTTTPPDDWRIVDAGAMGPLASVSLSGAAGYIGARGGSIYAVHDAPQLDATLVESKPGTDAVAAVAALPSGGFAVGDSAPATGLRIFNIDSNGATAAPAQTSVPLAAVAALGDSAAIAVEAPTACADGAARPAYWYRTGGLWQRAGGDAASFPAGSEPRGASMAGTSTSATEAIAGASPGAGGSCEGSVWLRTANPASAGGWNRADGLGAPLNGVAVISREQIWTAGERGTILHFHDPPAPPPADDGTKEPPVETPPPGGGDPEPAPAPPAGPPAPPAPTVTVEQPPAAPAPAPCTTKKTRLPQRLVSDIRVKVKRGKLLVSFALATRAKVTIQPRSHGRLVGTSRALLLEPGRHRVTVPYRGKRPPAELRILARPKPGKSDCTSQTDGNPR
jgi:hypothetical protein